MKAVFAVTYYDDGEDPVVTLFDNEPAARKCFDYFCGEHDRVNIDAAPIFTAFIIDPEGIAED